MSISTCVRGEIHALLGENGAGKSTFAKILAGVHRPTRGTLALNGQPVEIANPIAAQKLGITLIHQEPISFPDLSVAENLVLGRTRRRAGSAACRGPQMTREARRLMDLLGVKIDVTAADARPLDRRPADGRDRPRARQRQPAHHHGRADRAADAQGGRDPVRASRAACATKAAPSSSSATGSRKSARSATASPSSATATRSRPTRSATSAMPTSSA